MVSPHCCITLRAIEMLDGAVDSVYSKVVLFSIELLVLVTTEFFNPFCSIAGA